MKTASYTVSGHELQSCRERASLPSALALRRCEKIWHRWAGAPAAAGAFSGDCQPRRPQRSAPADFFTPSEGLTFRCLKALSPYRPSSAPINPCPSAAAQLETRGSHRLFSPSEARTPFLPQPFSLDRVLPFNRTNLDVTVLVSVPLRVIHLMEVRSPVRKANSATNWLQADILAAAGAGSLDIST